MKIRIVVNYAPRYRRGHLVDFVSPVTGMHLAALTPPEHEVELFHEQVRPVPVDDMPDLVALSFFSGFARSAYALADRYRALGVPVVAGGPHVSYWIEEALEHVDAVVVGEAETVWMKVIADAGHGRLGKIYRGMPAASAFSSASKASTTPTCGASTNGRTGQPNSGRRSRACTIAASA